MTDITLENVAEVAAAELAPRSPRTPTAMIDGIAISMAERVMTSTEVEERVAESGPWAPSPGTIERLTGVRERRVANDDEHPSTFAIRAARQVLEETGTASDEIDCVIFASSCQDITEPATVHVVQEAIGTTGNAFDVKNACNSFLNAMHIGETMIAAGAARKVLVCTGETPTRGIRWSVPDEETWRRGFAGYTVGDGGAAMLLGQPRDGRGIWHTRFRTQSQHWRAMTLPGGGSLHPRDEEFTYYDSDGSSLKEAFIEMAPAVVGEGLIETGVTFDHFDFCIAHHISQWMLDMIIMATGMPEEKFMPSAQRFGNVSSISMVLQLDDAIRTGKVAPGDQVLALGFGAGVTMGVMMITV